MARQTKQQIIDELNRVVIVLDADLSRLHRDNSDFASANTQLRNELRIAQRDRDVFRHELNKERESRVIVPPGMKLEINDCSQRRVEDARPIGLSSFFGKVRGWLGR